MPTDSEVACFEAGIKFGTLYHQFTGTPIENQPHCTDVGVEIHDDRLDEAIDPGIGYTELRGPLMSVEIVVEYEGCAVTAAMELEEGYPRMRVVGVEDDSSV
jgi:hypothetical protein